MPVISSESIFHLTSKDNLIGILQNTFYPRLCHERVELKEVVIKAYFPMVSFCDIPLSQIKDHMEHYGKYGLGMSRNWARKQGLNPVLYIRKESYLSTHLQALPTVLREQPYPVPGESEISNAALAILQYTKAFEGTWLKGKTVTEEIKFYNEREIRYVPRSAHTGFYFLTEAQYRDEQRREEARLILERFPLSFEPDDINYIIISSDSERVTVANLVQSIKEKYDGETKLKLITKLLSYDQIRDDF
jgi:hypothetical protein